VIRRADGRPLVIAHRGASAYAPEHTFAAWDLALDMGADYLEQDLQMTSDGVLVVLHDATLDRTARGPDGACTGPVIERTFEQLRACDAGCWFGAAFAGQRIPALDDVLARYRGRARFYIETKQPGEAPGMEQALVALLRRHGLLDAPPFDGLPAVIVQSFSAQSLRLMRRLAPAIPAVQLFEALPAARIIDQLDDVRARAAGIGPSRDSVDAALVAAADARGLVVHPYTVNDVVEMQHLLDLGVHGMFTDAPDRLLAIR
jgi:glycerophosphoryl diester phosphodiesterase